MKFNVNKFVDWCVENNQPPRYIKLALSEWARELHGLTKEEIYEIFYGSLAQIHCHNSNRLNTNSANRCNLQQICKTDYQNRQTAKKNQQTACYTTLQP